MMNIAQIGAINAVVVNAAGGGDPITYFGSSSNPADNGSLGNTATPSITPPASMVSGQLALLVAATEGATSLTINNAGGQTWNALTEILGATRARIFWCIFDGTWDADPSVNTAGGANDTTTLVMHVFSPPAGHTTWAVDVAQSAGPIFPTGSVYTISGQTTTQASTVTLATWRVDGAAYTWGSITGSGWAVTGDAQYRNTFDTDSSHTFAHKIQTSAGANGNVSKTASGTAGGFFIIVTFYSS